MCSTKGICEPLATPDIEKTFVHGVYDAIAPHFSSTRYAKWPKVSSFLDSLAPGSVILDAGCGNGKYLGLNPQCFFVGCDLSFPLVSICNQKGHEVIVADTVNLPYRTGFFDAAISIAVMHHLSTEERRRRAVEELARTVVIGGKILITVWAVEQEDKNLLKKWTPLSEKYSEEWVGNEVVKCNSSKQLAGSLQPIKENDFQSAGNTDESKENNATSAEQNKNSSDSLMGGNGDNLNQDTKSESAEHQDFFVPWHLPYHRAEIGSTTAAVASGFARKDEKKSAVVYNRYYHVFIEGELERLVSTIGGVSIFDRFYDKSNWCVILERQA